MSNIGRMIYGYCNGFFGRDAYNDKRIEAEGIDWVVARELEDSAIPVFTCVPAKQKQSLIDAWSVKQ